MAPAPKPKAADSGGHAHVAEYVAASVPALSDFQRRWSEGLKSPASVVRFRPSPPLFPCPVRGYARSRKRDLSLHVTQGHCLWTPSGPYMDPGERLRALLRPWRRRLGLTWPRRRIDDAQLAVLHPRRILNPVRLSVSTYMTVIYAKNIRECVSKRVSVGRNRRSDSSFGRSVGSRGTDGSYYSSVSASIP